MNAHTKPTRDRTGLVPFAARQVPEKQLHRAEWFEDVGGVWLPYDVLFPLGSTLDRRPA